METIEREKTKIDRLIDLLIQSHCIHEIHNKLHQKLQFVYSVS